MNFRIVEDSTPRYAERYDDFIRMYNDGVTIKKILGELDWSQNTYRGALEKAVEKGHVRKRTRGRRNPKYYHKYYSQWRVERKVDGKLIRTQCRTEEDAKNIVRYLNRHGWSKDNIIKWKRGVV